MYPDVLAGSFPTTEQEVEFRRADRTQTWAMPVLFYRHEPNEAAHIHVDRDDLSAKFWLAPAALALGV